MTATGADSPRATVPTPRPRDMPRPLDSSALDAAAGLAAVTARVADLERMHSSVLESLFEGIMVFDPAGVVTMCNGAAVRVLGVPRPGLCGTSGLPREWRYVRPDGSEWTYDDLPVFAALRSGQPQHVDALGVIPPDGSLRWLTVTAVLIRDDQARGVSGAICSMTDVTAQIEAAQALQEREQRFTLAFECSATGMVITSPQPGRGRRIERANAAFAEMVGRTVEQLTGMALADLTHPVVVARDEALYADLLAGGEDSAQWETQLRRADNRTVFALASAAVARDELGVPMYFITQVVDDTARHTAQADLERLALTDGLTGLANRTLLTDRITQALARMRREDTTMALLLIDVDRFKVINDSLGPQSGDDLLQAIAMRLRAICRADTTVARVGGDEFAVLVDGLPHADTVDTIAQRILGAARRPFRLGEAGEEVVTSASIGVVVTSDPDREPDQLYREADLALHRAKEGGRDRVERFDEELRNRAVQRLGTERLLRSAITETRLVAYYQPLVDLHSGRIVGAEALVRLKDPVHGILGPPMFIDVAEESGLIVDVDSWMLDEASRTMSAWAKEDNGIASIAVNVSARTLAHRNFLELLKAATDRAPADQLHLEITERVVLGGEEAASGLLDEARALGASLGIDDFGTGYSALAYLQRLTLDFVKIDRSFITPLGTDPQTAAIVGAIISLAHALDLRVVAEGVENEEQLRLLRALNCDIGQGFLFGKPMAVNEFEHMVASAPRW